MLRLTTLCDDSEETVKITPKQNNSDFDWWGILQTKYVGDYEDLSKSGSWLVTAYIVAPSQLDADSRKSACSCSGQEDWPEDPTQQIDLQLSSGHGLVPIFDKQGNNRRTLEKAAHQQLSLSTFLTGFYLDRPVNRIGTTGWELLTGDVLAGLYH